MEPDLKVPELCPEAPDDFGSDGERLINPASEVCCYCARPTDLIRSLGMPDTKAPPVGVCEY